MKSLETALKEVSSSSKQKAIKEFEDTKQDMIAKINRLNTLVDSANSEIAQLGIEMPCCCHSNV